jgi:hypothetical protein
MKIARRVAVSVALAMLLGAIAPDAVAQPPGLEIQSGFRQSYRLTLENGMRFPIYLKVAHVEIDVGNDRFELVPGEVLSQRFLGGERVVMVWDRRGTLVLASPLTVDRSGFVVLESPHGGPAPVGRAAAGDAFEAAPLGAPGAAASRAPAAAGALQIRPEQDRPAGQPAQPRRGGGGLQVQPSEPSRPR